MPGRADCRRSRRTSVPPRYDPARTIRMTRRGRGRRTVRSCRSPHSRALVRCPLAKAGGCAVDSCSSSVSWPSSWSPSPVWCSPPRRRQWRRWATMRCRSPAPNANREMWLVVRCSRRASVVATRWPTTRLRIDEALSGVGTLHRSRADVRWTGSAIATVTSRELHVSSAGRCQ